MRNALVACALLAATAASVAGAETPDLPVGATVRLSVREDGRAGTRTLRGTLMALEPGTLSMRPNGKSGAFAVRAGDVVTVERLVRPGNRKKGALLGAAALGGAMLGMFLGLCSTDLGCEDADADRVMAVIGGAAGLGALIGAGAARGDRWRSVPVERLAGVALAPRGGPRVGLSAPGRGPSLALSVSF